MHFYAFECAFLISLARYWHVHDANYFLPTFCATSAQGLLFGTTLERGWKVPIFKIHSFTDSPLLRSVDYWRAILTQPFVFCW